MRWVVMSIEYLIKRWSIITLVSLLIIGLVVPGTSLSRTEARYELKSGDLIFGNDLGVASSTQTLFHQQALDTADVEAVNVDFPLFSESPAGNTVAGPVIADGSSANVLPFGLVDLAMPSISQSSFQSVDATNTGFYQANFLGIPPINNGAGPVLAGPEAGISPVGPPTSLIGSNMMFPEMTNIMPGYDAKKAHNALAGDPVHTSISGQELTGGESSVPINYPPGADVTGQGLSYPYFNFKAKQGAISGSSLLERMWRNSHLGTMGRAYEGDTSYPTWILPTEHTKSAVVMADWDAVNDLAMKQTVPGTHLTPRWWSLGITSLDGLGTNVGDIFTT